MTNYTQTDEDLDVVDPGKPPRRRTYTGGAPRKHTYKGRQYTVRTGPKGGKYIVVKGQRVYI